MIRVLFVCSRNRLRSPTAEQVFSTWPGIECASAGVDRDADVPLDAGLVAWADLVFVMEPAQRRKLATRFRRALRARVVCLGIPDDYAYMEPALVERLLRQVGPHLPRR